MLNMSWDIIRPGQRVVEVAREGSRLCPTIEVVNLGRVDVSIDEVGLRAKRSRQGNRAALIEDLVLPKMEKPYRLQAGAAVSLTCSNLDVRSFPPDFHYAYAETSAGRIFWRRLRRFSSTVAWLKRL